MNIHLTPSEFEALAWISDRYTSADVLCGAEMRAAREALGDPDPWAECEGWFSHSACDVCGSGRWEDDDPFANGRLGGTRYHGVTFPR